MRILLKIIPILVFILSTCSLSAQVSDYTLTSSSVTIGNENIAIGSTLSKTGNDLRWIQQSSETVNITDFQITGTSGDWNQSTSMGMVTYNIAMDGDDLGTFVLEGTTAGVTVILTLDQQQHSFSINTITYQ
ncbi:hypothetical protein GCM10011531_28190 [Aquaticitalea lipolytica]|uniref:Uncharacterized protein n=1 Tax=Aquaticitalea lipolytica TaxID=1247562 RepID=A0A8J2TS48_9FLAO|nr:hypothetical protein [Aquaticitalea lipolytica]GFZ94812.1 hypothetical protein GCM10011531_28150 [Aquaticitalea lipolytica]GFZ94835.1 hypothetical protein GCM10011531_28190 [Aquaticitalea lipolytica]